MTKAKKESEKRGKASILKEDDVRRIRQLAASGEKSAREMALYYNVNAETVRRVIRRETWTSLPALDYKNDEELAQLAKESQARLLKMLEEVKEEPELTQREKEYKALSKDFSIPASGKIPESLL